MTRNRAAAMPAMMASFLCVLSASAVPLTDTPIRTACRLCQRRCAPLRAYIHADHVEDDAEDAHCRHRGDERDGEVVGDVGLDGGNLAEGAHHPVAEVVVADRLAAQPGVFGVSDLRVDGGAEEGEVHRLLGVVDEGVVGAEERPADEEDEEYRLGDDDGAPLAGDEVAEVVEVAVGDVNGQRRHEQHEGDCDGLHGGDVGESE